MALCSGLALVCASLQETGEIGARKPGCADTVGSEPHILDLHGLAKRGRHACVHDVRSTPKRHGSSSGMVRRGLGRALASGPSGAAGLVRGSSLHAERRTALESQVSVAGAAAVRNRAAAPVTADLIPA